MEPEGCWAAGLAGAWVLGRERGSDRDGKFFTQPCRALVYLVWLYLPCGSIAEDLNSVEHVQKQFGFNNWPSLAAIVGFSSAEEFSTTSSSKEKQLMLSVLSAARTTALSRTQAS